MPQVFLLHNYLSFNINSYLHISFRYSLTQPIVTTYKHTLLYLTLIVKNLILYLCHKPLLIQCKLFSSFYYPLITAKHFFFSYTQCLLLTYSIPVIKHPLFNQLISNVQIVTFCATLYVCALRMSCF